MTVLEELRAQCAPLRFAPLPELAGPQDTPAGSDWFSAADLVGPQVERVDDLLAGAKQAAPAGPHAVHTLRTLLRELIFCVVAADHLLEAAPVVAPTGYWYRASEPTEVARRRLVVPAVARVGGPAPVGPADLRLADTAALHGRVAEDLVATVAPVVSTVRARSRVGPRTLWSYVLDMIHFNALTLARQLGRDRTAAWERASALAEAVHAAGAPRFSRPQLVRFGDAPQEVWGVRGACCLDFKDPAHGMCLTCPLLESDARAAKWTVSGLQPSWA